MYEFNYDYNEIKTVVNRIFVVLVPYLATMSDSQIKSGKRYLSVQNNQLVENDYDALVKVGLPIKKLAKVFSEGFPIKLVYKEDLKTLEEALVTYTDLYRGLGLGPNMDTQDADEYELVKLFADEFLQLQKSNLIEYDTFSNFLLKSVGYGLKHTKRTEYESGTQKSRRNHVNTHKPGFDEQEKKRPRIIQPIRPKV